MDWDCGAFASSKGGFLLYIPVFFGERMRGKGQKTVWLGGAYRHSMLRRYARILTYPKLKVIGILNRL